MVWLAAAILIALSFILFALNRSKDPLVTKVMRHVNRINSYALVVGAMFTGLVAVFGARWLTMPRHFIDTYTYNGMDFSGGEVIEGIRSAAAFFAVFFNRVWQKIVSFDPVIFVCLGIYLVNEVRFFKSGGLPEKASRFKRLTLLVFLIPFFASIFTMGRFSGHHMLPFFAAAAVLAVQGAEMFRMEKKRFLYALMCVVLLADIGYYGSVVVKSRLHHFRQHDDIAYVIGGWWRENISPNARIVAEHYNSVYIPDGFSNVKTVSWNGKDEENQLKRLVNEYKPRYIYYGTGPQEGYAISDIQAVLPDKKLKLLKAFDPVGRKYQAKPGVTFYMYEVLD
jgi:hypothetical protein